MSYLVGVLTIQGGSVVAFSPIYMAEHKKPLHYLKDWRFI